MSLTILPTSGHEFAVSPAAVAYILPGEGDSCTLQMVGGGAMPVALNSNGAAEMLGIKVLGLSAPGGSPTYVINTALVTEILPISADSCRLTVGGNVIEVGETLGEILSEL